MYERERERERACRKRILTGTAVIWRALCTTIVKRRAEKRKTRDDVRFSRGRSIRLYNIMRRNKTRRAFPPAWLVSGPSRNLFAFIGGTVESVGVPEGRLHQHGLLWSTDPSHIRDARDKLRTGAACAPMQFQRVSPSNL